MTFTFDLYIPQGHLILAAEEFPKTVIPVNMDEISQKVAEK